MCCLNFIRTKIRRSLLILLLILFGGRSQCLIAQADSGEGVPVLFGLHSDIGYGYTRHLFSVFPGSTDCGSFNEGKTTEGTFGPEILLPTFFPEKVSLSGRLLVGISGSTLVSSAEPFVINQNAIGTGQSNEVELAKYGHEYRLSEKRVAARLEILAGFSPASLWMLRFGGSLGYTLSETYEQVDYITDNIFRFAGGVREREIPRSDIVTSSWMAGGIFSLGANVPISSTNILVPEFSLRLETHSFQSAFQHSNIVASFGLSFLTDFAQKNSEPPLPVIPLSASIDLQTPELREDSMAISRIYVEEVFRGQKGDERWSLDRKVYPPTIMINPEWKSSEGVKEWSIRFVYGDIEIGEMSSANKDELSELNWKIADNPEMDTAQTLQVKMVVVDSSGAVAEATDRINLHLKRSRRFVYHDANRIIWTVGGFSQESPIEAARDLLLDLLDVVEPGDHILLQPRKGLGGETNLSIVQQMHTLAADLHALMRDRGITGVGVDLLPTTEVEIDRELFKDALKGEESDHQIEMIVQKR